MSVPVDVITDICRRVAAEHSPSVEVLGVVSGEGGTGRVEVLVTLPGGEGESLRLSLNLSRANQPTLEKDLHIQLREALKVHTAS